MSRDGYKISTHDARVKTNITLDFPEHVRRQDAAAIKAPLFFILLSEALVRLHP